MANEHKVFITKRSTVYPKPQPSHTHGPILRLSNLDRQCPTLMYVLLFYKPTMHQNLAIGPLFQSLKMGLEKALSIWYPAAGRLTLNPTNGKLDLLCNNSGAVFVEANTKIEISDLGDLSQHSSFYEKLVYMPDFTGNFPEMPLMVAQVTGFGCGGYTVGIGISHSLFDGLGAYNFLCAWAMLATGRSSESSEMFEPVHQRDRLAVETTQNQVCKSVKDQVKGVVAIDHLYQLIEQANAGKHGELQRELGACKFAEISSANHDDYVLRTFSLTRAMIESLKRKINGGNSSSKCSTFEVVAAHLWKARTKALGLSNDRKVCLHFAVDARNKLVPPLPSRFCGNAYVLASVSCTAGILERETFQAIVEKIKQAKDSITDEYVSHYMEALGAPQSSLPPLLELTIVSDWSRNPFHKVDFGHGNAIYASPLASPLPHTAYFMQSPNEVGAIDVRIGFLPQHLHSFSHQFQANLER